MGGFVAIDGAFIDSYAVCYVKTNHTKSGCEMMLTCGKIVYSKLSASEAVQQLATARAECEGRS